MVEQSEFWEKCRFYKPPWDPVPRAFVVPKLELIARCCGVGRASTILDVGCGNGTFTYYWRQLADNTVGVDFSRNMLAMHGADFRSVQGDALRLPFPDGAFEVVFESALLHHVPEPLLAAKEMRRVASRCVAFVEPNALNPGQVFHSLCWPAERQGLRFTLWYLCDLARRAGLRILARQSTGAVYDRRTPEALLPLLRKLDAPFPFAAYNVVVCCK